MYLIDVGFWFLGPPQTPIHLLLWLGLHLKPLLPRSILPGKDIVDVY